jgi:hypothetical protein
MNWQSIDTAPKDGTPIIVARIESERLLNREVARYDGFCWMVSQEDDLNLFTPTHWLPLSQYRPA